MAPRRIAVVGAGPSGLVVAKYLLQDNTEAKEVVVLEASSKIGGTFVNKVYDNTRLVSSKYLTAFSDYRMPKEYPNHPTAEQYVQYLESYSDRFGITPHIQFQCRVLGVRDHGDGDDSQGYSVTYRNDKDNQEVVEHFDWVAICSGLHTTPNIPVLPQESRFRGQILHSSLYKDPSIFSNKRVLVLGSGETAMDICFRAVQNPDCGNVAMNVRRGFLSIPHTLPNDQPLDVFITNWLEHSHEHHWVQKLRLRWWLSTFVIRCFLLLSGSSVGFNQWACHTTPIKRGYHIINKSHSAMSHLNVPVKRKAGLLGKFWLWFYDEQNLKPVESFHRTSIVGIDDNGVTVHFDNGQTFDADIIVLATGYKQSFPFLDKKIQQDFKEEEHLPSNNDENYRVDEAPLPSEHFIVSPSRPRLSFIGFVRPNVGAIPPMSELQTMWWLCKLKGKLNQPFQTQQQPSYMVLGHKYPYGVDYGNYMHRVAEEMDAAPKLSMLATSASPFKALFTYCQGQAYIGLFRLQGPYASKRCWQIFQNELWIVCRNRGWLENSGLVAVTLLSLGINLAACVLECGYALVTLQPPRFFCRYP